MLRKGDLAKLATERPAGIVLLVEAALWLMIMSVAIRILAFGRIARILGLSESGEPIAPSSPPDGGAQDIRRAVRAVAARLPWTCTCLSQALAGMALLTRRGLPGTLSLGVAKGGGEAQGEFLAHAWLNCGDVNIAGEETSASFTPLARFVGRPAGAKELTPEFRLFRLAVGAAPKPDEIRRLASAVTDWETVPASARRHRVTQAVFVALRDHAAGIAPPAILEDMRVRSLVDQATCHAQAVELTRIGRAGDAAGIAMLVLKGIPLSLGLYGRLAARGAGDIDILVDPAQLRHAGTVLEGLGYVRQGARIFDRRQTVCQSRIKDVAYVHRTSGQMVELHQRLTENPHLLPWRFPALWRNRDEVMVNGTAIATLPRRDLALYLCIHGASHCWERLRWLVDLAELLRAPGAVEAALADANGAGLGAPMREAITLCHHWLELPVAPENLLEPAALAPFIRRFFEGGRWNPAVRPGSLEWLRRYSFWGRIHSWSLRSDWRYRLRELSGILIWPPDWETIALPDALFWLYPFLRPVAWALRRWPGQGP